MKKRKTIRRIEEYSNETNFIHKDYLIEITTEELLKILDYKIHPHDHPDHVGEPYLLNQNQINQLKPYLKEPFKEDLVKYEYYTAAYDGGNEDGTPDDPIEKQERDPNMWKRYKILERNLIERDAKTDNLHQSYPLNISSEDLLKIINYELNPLDFKELVFLLYMLNQEQVEKIKAFLTVPFQPDFEKYTYEVDTEFDYADDYTPTPEEIN